MASSDDLIISIRADITQLRSALNETQRELRTTQSRAGEAGKAIKDALGSLLGLAAATEGLKKLVEVNREFGILKAGLETATGSAEGATEAFAALQQFAQTTPYDLAQSTKAFTQLVNLGLTPSERALKSYGDTSAALGKDLSQMVEAVADAATGEFERLKEFGIKAKNQGDTIAFTFRGVTDTVANNSAAIEEYLIKMGEVNFDGAMKKRMDSLDGALSNLSDAFDQFFYQVGQAGGTDLLKDAFVGVGNAISEVNAMLASGQMQGYIEAIGLSFGGWAEDVQNAIDEINTIFDGFVRDNGSTIQEAAVFFSKAFSELPQNIRAFVQIAITEFAYTADVASIYGTKIANALNPMSPSYDLKGNLKRAELAYQESLEAILEQREKTTKDAANRKIDADAARENYDSEAAAGKNKADVLGKFGVAGSGKQSGSTKADEKKQKEAARLKEEAAKYLDTVSELNLTESALNEKHYNDEVKKLDGFLSSKSITRKQYDEAELQLFVEKIGKEAEIGGQAEQAAIAQREKEKAMADERIKAIIEDGLTEQELLKAHLDEKLLLLQADWDAQLIGEGDFYAAKMALEQKYNTDRAAIADDGEKRKKRVTDAFNKGNLQGFLAFNSEYLSSAAGSNRKFFELNKTAKLAEAAMNIPSAVSGAYTIGAQVGGPVLGAAFGATAFAAQVANLKAIQSATFGGGGSSGGGSAGVGGAASAAQTQQAPAPVQQRFVDINLYGSENAMFSKDSVRDLIKRINVEVKDGAVLRTN